MIKNRTQVIRAALVLLALVSVQAAVLAQQEQGPALPFAHGEQLLYQAEFNRSLLRGVDVGELRFSAKLTPARNGTEKAVVTLTGDAVTKGLLIRLAGSKFRLRFESLVEPNHFSVQRTSKLYQDRRGTLTSEALFDHATRKVTWTERKENDGPRVAILDFNEPIQDVLSLIYFVRTQNLKPGQTFEVSMVDAGRVYRCVVNVTERKRLKTVLGRVDALRLEPAIFDGDRAVRSRGMLSVWLTDDHRRIPVKAQVKAPIGTIDIKLKRVTYSEAHVAR